MDMEDKLLNDDSIDNRVYEILLNNREQFELINSLIKNQIEVKDRQIDRLHEELESYRQENASKYVDQVMKGIIKVRKDMIRQLSSDKWDAITVEDIKKEYQYVFEDLSDILEQQNIEAFRTEAGEPFNATVHIPKTEATDNKALDRTVKESMSEGYKKGDRILIPERVAIYKFTKNEEDM